ncbi:hypothetical protein DFH07DRAFT_961288 [Mycena maculata]|uniref:RBR-type E3 ubiquitin transferase n=1 Tax=Mycena maculata TaxID=230809 RepID=A0AAD7IUE2_9AGAR|nr:hypothetical protein DFH07DRAFT_961288 [Mycena maculata]
MDQHLIAAAVMQSEFHAEDRLLRLERAELQAGAFECSMCLEIYPQDCVSRVSGCPHEFCRDCLRAHVISTLKEEVLPTFCPMCVSDDARGEPGRITGDLIEMAGLTEEQCRLFRELEISPQRLYIFLDCPKCKESMLVSRMDYEEASVLECLLPGCKHMWCKVCQRTIFDLAAAIEHLCDGLSDLQGIAQGKGWKSCPGCQTPYEKIEGSDHVQRSSQALALAFSLSLAPSRTEFPPIMHRWALLIVVSGIRASVVVKSTINVLSTLAVPMSMTFGIGLSALAIGAQQPNVSVTAVPAASSSAAPHTHHGLSTVEILFIQFVGITVFLMVCCCGSCRSCLGESFKILCYLIGCFIYGLVYPIYRVFHLGRRIWRPMWRRPRRNEVPLRNENVDLHINPIRTNTVPVALPQPIVILSHRRTADEPTSRGKIGPEDEERRSLIIQHPKRVHSVPSRIPSANLEPETSSIHWDHTQQTSDESVVAAEVQRLFDDEDRRLCAERVALQGQRFHCIICLDEHPRDNLAPIPGCTHTFCRDCIRGYVLSDLTQKILPAVCPQCRSTDARNNPGLITGDLVKTLVTSEEYRMFQELELNPLVTFLECLKCKESLFVDRQEYEAGVFLVCPVEGCNHTWCRICGKTIDDLVAPVHECIGEAELHALMERRGWKYCPGCRTPYEKTEGCNHMQCSSPGGCGTHFCYKCGEVIVRSAPAPETQEAVRAHYRRCTMFQVD